jgi:hypothetical protein
VRDKVPSSNAGARAAQLSRYAATAMGVGTITFHRFNGTERFAIREAVLYLLKGDASPSMSFDFKAEGAPIVTSVPDDAESLRGSPSGEFNVDVPVLDVSHLVGRVFTIPLGDPDGDWLARIYYVDHNAARNCTVRVLERDGDRFRVTVSGYCTDFNYCDGSKPDTRFMLDAWFALHS